MKSILVIANSLGGLYTFRKEVISAIIKDGYRVVIASPHDLEERESFFVDLGCVFEFYDVDRHGTNPIRDFKLIGYYRKLIKKHHPIAALTYTIKPNIFGGIAARREHVPQLANITGLGTAVENPGTLQKLTIFLYRYGLKNTQKVYYQNTSIQDFCQKHHIGKNGCLLPGSGVNLEWFSFQNYPLEDSKLKFNFIGRIMKDKGIEEFIEMAEAIHKKYPQTEFHFLGRCEEQYEEKLKVLEKEGIGVWHGSVFDVRPYIKDAWCTILPSYHEGMANVLLESCAMGRPIIASNINGCKEAIEDGVNGFLCKVKDSEDLYEKVERFILLPYDQKVKMGLEARKKVEQEFDRKTVIDYYLTEIESINNNE